MAITTKFAVLLVWKRFTVKRIGPLKDLDSTLNEDKYINILSQEQYFGLKNSILNGYALKNLLSYSIIAFAHDGGSNRLIATFI